MHSHHRSEMTLAAVLASAAGFVDAVGFIHLGGYFVSFMSGNSTRGGTALAEGNWTGFALAFGLVAAFLAGVVSAAILRRMVRSRKRMAVLLYVTAALTSAVVLFDLGIGGWLAPAIMALAMGAENVIFERDGEVSIGLTYMTGTLVKMGQHIANALTGGQKTLWVRYFALWMALTSGSIMGGFAYLSLDLNALWIAVGVLVLAVFFNSWLRARPVRRGATRVDI
ncbi:YoaK family protein [Arthrobacter sp. H35-D1]|uniref:YoaK family protein n=1 Tax=Arthrobacter sp. H35-D1 TaxID=3046202 RepID=UPI0024BABE4E|nr:YoaK family protein [Arthrobacter sp. H35-D1]MDJ0312419.1 YoaK family protein [Arthrobacter sp. H35-D1]